MSEATALKMGHTIFLQTHDLQMFIPGTNEPSGWVITLAGPAHPQSIEHFERVTRRLNKRSADIERAQVMGRKWKGDEEKTPDESRRETVEGIAARILGWSPNPDFEDGAGAIEFSREAAIKLFMDRSKGAFFAQIVEYLTGEKAFLKASANV